MLMRYWKVLVSVILVLLFAGCGTKEGTATRPIYKNGDKVELTNVYGNQKLTLLRKDGGFVLESDPKKMVILDIFGTFCGPCQSEAPKITNFVNKNRDNFVFIGLNYLEDVTNDYVVKNFTEKFAAYYFIANKSNGHNNDKLVDTIAHDIGYPSAIQVPFKVVLKDGKYQKLTDTEGDDPNIQYYIGAVDLNIIQSDIDKILKR